MQTERGMYGGEVEERCSMKPCLSFFFFLIVAFSNRIELRWRVLGEYGVTAENIGSILCRAGSENEGEEIGLRGDKGLGGEEGAVGSGGKSSKEESLGTTGDSDAIGGEIGKESIRSTEARAVTGDKGVGSTGARSIESSKGLKDKRGKSVGIP